MPVFVPASGFSQQIEEFAKQLAYLSDDVFVHDDGASPVRATSYSVEIRDALSRVTATFDYREEFTRMASSWVRSRYWYELRLSDEASTGRSGRRAHHQHASWGVHQHCENAGVADVHYRDVERLLQATHELFVKQYASGLPVDCSGLVPLRTPQARPPR